MLRLVIILLLLAAALVARAPAWLAADRIAGETDGLVRLQNASGTLWRGTGEMSVPLSSSGAIPLGTLRWQVEGVGLRDRSVLLTIEQTPGGLRPITATVTAGHSSAGGSLWLPATIAQRLPLTAGWTTGGTIVIESDRLDWDGRQAAGTLNLRWQNAAATPPGLPEPIALGDVIARVQFGPAGPAATISNSGGSVRLEGGLDARMGQVTLTVQPRPDAPPQLAALLQSRLGPSPAAGYTLAYTIRR